MGGHTVQGFLQKLVIHIPRRQILTVFLAFGKILVFAHLGYHGFLVSINQMTEVCLEVS